MNKKEKQPPQTIDLAGDAEDSELIKVGKRLYRVREDVLDARPSDYSRLPSEYTLLKRYCVICGFELGHPEDFSAYMGPEDCRCVVHRQPDGGRRIAPCCVYCGTRMEVVLPFEVLLHQLRFLWVCLDRHCYVVSDSIEGV